MPRVRVHCMSYAVLYADTLRHIRAVQRLRPEYAEVRAHTLHAMLRQQPGYSQAAIGKNKNRIRWFLRTVPHLPHEEVLRYLPTGVFGAVQLLRSVLPRKCTWLPYVTLDQLCVLVLELAPVIVHMTETV